MTPLAGLQAAYQSPTEGPVLDALRGQSLRATLPYPPTSTDISLPNESGTSDLHPYPHVISPPGEALRGPGIEVTPSGTTLRGSVYKTRR